MTQTPIRVLLVEDDPEDHVITRNLLAQVGPGRYVLDWARTYEEGLAECARREHDVLLIDYRLGARDGLELLREAADMGCKAPMILLTGMGDLHLDLEAMKAGAADYLTKSDLDSRQLERSIRYAMERDKANSELADARQRLAEGREAERLHLAQELHDGPLQDIYAVRFNLTNLAEEPIPAAARELLVECQSSLQLATERLRAICLELRPPALGPFGVESAIRAHAERFHQTHPEVELNLELMPDDPELPERTRLGLFRIYQQALSNLAQHSSATNVRVRLWRDDRSVYLEVRDDGRGFEVPERLVTLARAGHLGLLGAAERAEFLGGRLDVESEVGEGTCVTAKVPVE